MVKRKMGFEMAARWAVIELARFLGLPMIETEREFDVTGTVQFEAKIPSRIHTFSYHVDPTSGLISISGC